MMNSLLDGASAQWTAFLSPLIVMLSALIGFSAAWGSVRATLTAFQREIEELRKCLAPVAIMERDIAVQKNQIATLQKNQENLQEEIREVQKELRSSHG